MAEFSVAAAKDKLSSLIDKALDGEDVVVTRRGRPAVVIRPVAEKPVDRAAATARLRKWQSSAPRASRSIPYHRFSEWLNEDEG